MNIIEVENLFFGYTPQSSILKGIGFKVEKGTFLTVVGPNGAGKTTLLNLLCGVLKPRSGSVKIDLAFVESYTPKRLAQKAAVVRQEFIPVFGFTVREIVMMARTPYLGAFGFAGSLDTKIVDEALEITDTMRFAERLMAELSGGERQRVFIARAIAQNTPVLLLDEPTSHLDFKHQVAIYDLLKKMQREKGKTIVAVTHDINLAEQYCDETLLLDADGSYGIGKPEDILTAGRIERVFGVRVFSGRIKTARFFLPLGRLSKDIDA
jgi:iron complex transport system ATP-binding protein